MECFKRDESKMNWISRRWNAFWFTPTRPDNLAICRILFYGFLFLFYLTKDFSAWSSVADVLWRPMWSFRLLRIPALSPNAVGILQGVWKLALLLSCLGLFTRLSCVMSFLLGFYVLGLQHNFSRTVHNDAMLVIVLGILSASRCGDRWSLDALWRRRFATAGKRDCLDLSGEYRWPVRMVWLVMSIIYFASGFAKLRQAGLEWVFSDNISNLLLRHNYVGAPWTTWGLNLAQYSWLCRLLAGFTIVTEVGFPLAMFSRRLRWILLPGAFSMHLGILLLMGPEFWQFLFCYVFWIPWPQVLNWLRVGPGTGTVYAS